MTPVSHARSLVRCSHLTYYRSHLGAKIEYLLSSRAEIISRMHRPPPAEGNNLEELLGEEPVPPIPVPKMSVTVWPDEKAAAYCALTPPLETFMVVPDETRREQFFRVRIRLFSSILFFAHVFG